MMMNFKKSKENIEEAKFEKIHREKEEYQAITKEIIDKMKRINDGVRTSSKDNV